MSNETKDFASSKRISIYQRIKSFDVILNITMWILKKIHIQKKILK